MEGTLAARLSWARKEQGITLQQLAGRTNRAVSYLSQLEHGARANPTMETIEAVAAALGVRPAFLLGDIPAPPFDARAGLVIGAQAHTLGGRFRQYWAALPAGARWDYAHAEPDRRFTLVVEFLAAHFPQVEIAWMLGMSVPFLREIVSRSGSEVSLIFLQQISRVSGVPMDFLTHGVLDGAPDAHPARGQPAPGGVHPVLFDYLDALRLAMEQNVSPQRLASLIRNLADEP